MTAIELDDIAIIKAVSALIDLNPDASATTKAETAIRAYLAAIGAGGQAITQFRKAGCSDWYDGLPDNEDGRGPYETRTLYSHPAPSGMAVAVKPLKWTKAALDGKFGWLIIRYAQTPFGRYYVEKFGSENYRVSLSEQVLTSILPSSVDEGIAAAQADYERRILSALSQPHPADERVVEALPRPDAVSMASGTICLEYVDTDERDLAFDWLEAHGAGVALAASHMPEGGGKPTDHASTSPGPVNCSIRKRFQNEVSPRTCERCRLGPCPFFHEDGSSKALAAARAGEDGR